MQAGRCATPAVLGTVADMQCRHPQRTPSFHHALHFQPAQYATLRPRLARNPSKAPTRLVPCRAKASSDALAGLRILEWTGSPSEVQALDQVREKMAASPYSEQITEEQMRWFLLDRKFDVEAAVDKLIKMLRWRREFGADELKTTDVAKEAATGKAFLHTALDVQNRPVIIVRACKHVNGASPLLESQKLCVHTLDRAMERLPETGQETILGIFDLRGFTSKNADLGFIRFMVDVFFTFYPKRLSQVLFVDAPWIFMASWNVFKTWLSKYQALVRFVSAEQVRKEYFTSETVPEDFANEGFPRKRNN